MVTPCYFVVISGRHRASYEFVIIVSGNGLSFVRHQAIIILTRTDWETNLSIIRIKAQQKIFHQNIYNFCCVCNRVPRAVTQKHAAWDATHVDGGVSVGGR